MLFVIYLILLIGGMVLLGISFSLPILSAPAFVLGVLIVCGAVAVPITAGMFEQRREHPLSPQPGASTYAGFFREGSCDVHSRRARARTPGARPWRAGHPGDRA